MNMAVLIFSLKEGRAFMNKVYDVKLTTKEKCQTIDII
jgi:hypothetical protein